MWSTAREQSAVAVTSPRCCCDDGAYKSPEHQIAPDVDCAWSSAEPLKDKVHQTALSIFSHYIFVCLKIFNIRYPSKVWSLYDFFLRFLIEAKGKLLFD